MPIDDGDKKERTCTIKSYLMFWYSMRRPEVKPRFVQEGRTLHFLCLHIQATLCILPTSTTVMQIVRRLAVLALIIYISLHSCGPAVRADVKCNDHP